MHSDPFAFANKSPLSDRGARGSQYKYVSLESIHPVSMDVTDK